MPMDQGENQSTTVDGAAQSMLESGVLDHLDDNFPAEDQQENTDADETSEEDGAEDTDADEVEADETDDTDAEEEAEPDSEEADEETAIETLADLGEALETPVEELLDTLTHEVKVNGETQTVTLRELQNGFQMESDYRRKTAEHAQTVRDFEAQKAESLQRIETQHQVSAAGYNFAHNLLKQSLDSVSNNTAMQESDPVGWMKQREYLQSQLQQLEQVGLEAAKAYTQSAQQQGTEMAEARKQALSEASEQLKAQIPDYDKVKPEIETYLTHEFGVSAEEMATIVDHRIVVLADKARRYDQGQKAAKLTAKKTKKAPKLQPPGAKTKQVSARKKQLGAAKRRLRSSGKTEDAAAVIETML